MKFYDMHTHSRFSFDSTMSMEAAAERAVSLGLSGIAFTDHLDVNYMADGSDVYYDFGDYLEKVSEVKESFAGRLEILSAVEVGLQPHVVAENISRLSGYSFDYKIGSTHLIGRIDPYDGTYFRKEPDRTAAYRRYLREMIGNIGLYHDYCTVGHFDYIVRYASFADNTMYYDDFSDEFDEIIRLMLKYGLAFEVNTCSYDRTPFDVRVLKRYRELGGETVVIGSDAHEYGRIGRNFDAAAALIEYCGFSYIAHYRNMLPVYERI